MIIRHVQGMNPITKFEIPISIRNWDPDPDPDLNSKIICNPIAIAATAIADLLCDLWKFPCKNAMGEVGGRTRSLLKKIVHKPKFLIDIIFSLV